MEHRRCARTRLDLKTLIYQGGVPIATGRIRDAGIFGLFIETDYAELRRHQRVQCELQAGDGSPGAQGRVWACVVRCTGDGAGVEIDESDGPLVATMIASLGRSGAARD